MSKPKTERHFFVEDQLPIYKEEEVYIGDPCYVLPYWEDFCDAAFGGGGHCLYNLSLRFKDHQPFIFFRMA